MWCDCWNIKMNEDKAQGTYISSHLIPSEAHLAFNGDNIPSIDHVKYLDIFSVRGLHEDCT
jgi:hypothetical protein